MSVCPSAWNNSTPTGRIFVIFLIVFTKIYLPCWSLAEIRHKFLFLLAGMRTQEVINASDRIFFQQPCRCSTSCKASPYHFVILVVHTFFQTVTVSESKDGHARCNLSSPFFTSSYLFWSVFGPWLPQCRDFHTNELLRGKPFSPTPLQLLQQHHHFHQAWHHFRFIFNPLLVITGHITFQTINTRGQQLAWKVWKVQSNSGNTSQFPS